jgi:hypothetical protein
MGGSGEAGVAASAASAFGRDPLLAVLGEIEELFAGFVVENDRADRDLHDEVFAIAAGAVRAFAVAAALGRVFGIEAEVKERVAVDGRDDDNVAATAAIAARWAAARHVFFAAEGEAAVAAVAGFYRNSYFIDKHEKSR